jgi:succinate dehydrogenase/fumarate reductase flavoprotein subunit
MASQSDDIGRERPEELDSRVSRRAFLKAGGGGALTGAVAAAVLFEQSTAHAQARWTHEADVVVAGSGSAACVAALYANEAKASVIMLEKAAIFGGTTAKSGGAFWICNNHFMRQQGYVDKREDALRYLARTAYPTLYDPADSMRFGMPEDVHQLHAAFYDEGAPTVEAMVKWGVHCEIQIEGYGQGGKKQPFPDYYAQLPENKTPRGRCLVPTEGAVTGGAQLIRELKAVIDQRKIQVLMEHRVERLVVNGKGEVVGVEARTGNQTVSVRARKGVIFGTGGFTSNPDMSLNFLRGPIFGGCTVPTGEGDFVKIASSVRAKLGNMTNAWWWPQIVEQALQNRSTPNGIGQTPGDSVILVNCDGRRCCNEKIQYNERTQAHFYWDPVRGRYPNSIMIMVYDQSCRERFGGTAGLIVRPGLNAPYVLSAQTLDELATVVDRRLAQIASKTGNYRLDPSFAANLKDTIARFNQFAMTGKDLDFHRGEAPIEFTFHGPPNGNTLPNYMMKPIASSGPYYAVLIGGGTLDTKGGPKINAKAEVVDVDEKPIPGLYGAGNCIAAPAGQAYWAAGATIGSAITFGALAGKNAANAPTKQATAPRAVTRA